MNSDRSKSTTSGSITTSAGWMPIALRLTFCTSRVRSSVRRLDGIRMVGVGVSGLLAPNCLAILAVTLTAITKLHPLRRKHICGNIIHHSAIDQRLSVATDGSREHRQIDAFKNRVHGISVVPDHRLATHQIDGNGETRYRQLLQVPVAQVFSQHRIELAAAVLYRRYQ